PSGGATHDVQSALDVHRRNAGFCEGKVIRPVKMALLRMLVGRERYSFSPDHRCESGPERALIISEHLESAETPSEARVIDVEIGDDLGRGHRGMLREVLG